MFTGIIEALGEVTRVEKAGTNVNLSISSPLSAELKIDQSVSHNGVCLTVTNTESGIHQVTAIEETLAKTNLNRLLPGSKINLERCMQLGGRLDGHIVQGHTDQTATCIERTDQDGSWKFTFEYDTSAGNVTVEKGSVCINGVSLTVVNSLEDRFSVYIIPYTLENTNFKEIEPGSIVNLEFDIIGKYIARLIK